MPDVHGARLRQLRQQSGRKAGEFAALVGVSRGHLIHMECSTRPASIEVLYRIAGALGVNVSELTREQDATPAA